MTEQEAIDYIQSQHWDKIKLGLKRIERLLELLGNPQDDLKFVHVAGSNGKGSTAAMIESILRTAGYKTGLFTSPYLQKFNERIKTNGTDIGGDDLARITEHVKSVVDKEWPEGSCKNEGPLQYGEGVADFNNVITHPTQFEIITAIAMVYYKETQCDIVVLEVGMGGEYDATNIIKAPEVSVITNIGLEHTQYLGNTLSEIARNKGGIIKPYCDAVCYDGVDEVMQTLYEIEFERNARLYKADFEQINILEKSLDGQKFTYRGEEYYIHLLGEHQVKNACVVIEAIYCLQLDGYEISLDDVKSGLLNAVWPARFEVVSRDPLFIIDGGHNPQCASALADALESLMPGEKFIFLMGVMADKDYDQVLEIIRPFALQIVCINVDYIRALAADKLAEHISKMGIKAVSCKSVTDGIEMAKNLACEKNSSVVAFGSLYTAGEIREYFYPRTK